MLAEDTSEDDGIPKNEVSPLAYLYKPKLGRLSLFNAHQTIIVCCAGLTAGVAAGTVVVMITLAVCVYFPYPRTKRPKE